MAYPDGQTNITLMIPQKYLDILKKHVEKGTAGSDTRGLNALISSGCIDYKIKSK
jgi:hypothetical protein